MEFRTAVARGEWRLRELDGRPAPLGNGARAATLLFDADSARVSGFAGCNRYFGSYILEGRTLRFSGVGMTRMACAEGMVLEQQLADALEATRSYELSGDQLTLLGESGAVAQFDRPGR
jgi:heat shock protein HslJ